MKLPEYPFEIRKLTEDEGSGLLITFPDLPGCMSDGETVEEAIGNGIDAIKSWIKTARKYGDPIPKPKTRYSGQFVQRVPKSLHARLAARSKQEGVSMNTLVLTFIAQGLENKTAIKRKLKKPQQRMSAPSRTHTSILLGH